MAKARRVRNIAMHDCLSRRAAAAWILAELCGAPAKKGSQYCLCAGPASDALHPKRGSGTPCGLTLWVGLACNAAQPTAQRPAELGGDSLILRRGCKGSRNFFGPGTMGGAARTRPAPSCKIAIQARRGRCQSQHAGEVSPRADLRLKNKVWVPNALPLSREAWPNRQKEKILRPPKSAAASANHPAGLAPASTALPFLESCIRTRRSLAV